MEDTIISITTLLELLQSRFHGGRVRVREENGVFTLVPVTSDNKSEVKPHMRFIGVLSPESYDEICDALADTQRIDADEWQVHGRYKCYH